MQGFFPVNLLDPNQSEYIVKSKGRPIQLDEQEYQYICEFINQRYPMDKQPLLPQDTLSAQKIHIHGVSYSTAGSRDCNIIFKPTIQTMPMTQTGGMI